ncbi:thioredoxin domain-containing protein [Lutispora thermophila]|uniref:Spermatogenesis-associated protein 20-like TRX domain-containing protein n=1 Tax=Lutispora thermophila DSM 19022 TaxID=1122184 RepID=A0A1M6EW17_9FIRM|nr:thioredoxin domain-containing protein [Lutispora thermophila]SHI89581.1 hypothetical protein SAMN02745176_01730 [Lutispora thermophila DSM 19022]
MPTNKQANRLIYEKSPYLLQHAYNPVDWFPWCEAAFEKAKREDKPVFLSIGYSTCHWCHKIERESFEDEEVADILNKYYVSIKVDREERPDIDHIYMEVCQLLTGSGGWPLTIIMTPNKEPFFAGTYFPKKSIYGYRGLTDLLKKISDAWRNQRDELLNSAKSIIEALSREEYEVRKNAINEDMIYKAYNSIKSSFDEKYGGIGRAPKFPMPHNIMFLLRYYKMTREDKALQMAIKTLESMYRGGIYDHIGFGFSRYSTDEKWLVPHFEKMLYDNALLMYAYTEAYQMTKRVLFKDIAIQIGEYVMREMTSPMGAFYSAEDADSEGEEGKFYIWDKEEIVGILGKEDGELFCKVYQITNKGNFEGKNIPNLIDNESFKNVCKVENIAALKNKLFEYRKKRVHPFKDDKILTSWNGLMIAAMAFSGRVYGNMRFIDAAIKAADFIIKNLRRTDGRLMARYREGSIEHLAYLDDYSFLIWGLIELYQAVFDEKYLDEAVQLADDMIKLFHDPVNNGFFIYGNDGEKLITRPKDLYDGAIPSGNSVAANVLLKLSGLTEKNKYEDIVNQMFDTFGGTVHKHPEGYTHFLSAYMLAKKGGMKIVFVGENDDKEVTEMLKLVNNNFFPDITIAIKKNGDNNYTKINDRTTAYVCIGRSCSLPINDIYELSKVISKHQ